MATASLNNTTTLQTLIEQLRVPATGSQGMWMVGSDGGVFSFGDAPFDGPVPGQGIVSRVPIDGIVTTTDGGGYWVVGRDGSLFSYGDANHLGSHVGVRLAAPIAGAAVAS